MPDDKVVWNMIPLLISASIHSDYVLFVFAPANKLPGYTGNIASKYCQLLC